METPALVPILPSAHPFLPEEERERQAGPQIRGNEARTFPALSEFTV